MGNVELVKHVYDRFAHGDAAAVLAVFDDAIEFRLAEGHPYQLSRKPWVGKDAVTRNFFMRAAGEWEDWTVHPQRIIEATGAVVVEGRYTGTYKPTRRSMDLQICHVWTIRNGKITSFHQYLDTAQLQELMGAVAELRVSSR